eukprot:gene19765-14363_t
MSPASVMAISTDDVGGNVFLAHKHRHVSFASSSVDKDIELDDEEDFPSPASRASSPSTTATTAHRSSGVGGVMVGVGQWLVAVPKTLARAVLWLITTLEMWLREIPLRVYMSLRHHQLQESVQRSVWNAVNIPRLLQAYDDSAPVTSNDETAADDKSPSKSAATSPVVRSSAGALPLQALSPGLRFQSHLLSLKHQVTGGVATHQRRRMHPQASSMVASASALGTAVWLPKHIEDIRFSQWQGHLLSSSTPTAQTQPSLKSVAAAGGQEPPFSAQRRLARQLGLQPQYSMQAKQPSRSRFSEDADDDDNDETSAVGEGESADRIDNEGFDDAAMSSPLRSRSREYGLLYRRTDHLPAAIDQVLTVFYGPAFPSSSVVSEHRHDSDAVVRPIPLSRRWHHRIAWQESLQLLHHILALYTPVSLTSAGGRRQASLPAEVIAEILH